jgi:hypothetical protein
VNGIGCRQLFERGLSQQSRVFREFENRSADEMRRGLVPRNQEQEHHGSHLVTILFDADEFGNQALPRRYENQDAFPIPPRSMGCGRRKLLEHIAGLDDFEVATAAYRAALTRWPNSRVILRQGARIVHDGGPRSVIA